LTLCKINLEFVFVFDDFSLFTNWGCPHGTDLEVSFRVVPSVHLLVFHLVHKKVSFFISVFGLNKKALTVIRLINS